MELDKIPPAIGKGNHITTLGELVDNEVFYYSHHFAEIAAVPDPVMRKFLNSFARRVLDAAREAMAKGAQRGVEQARELIEDPAYTETRRKRRGEQRAKDAAARVAHQKEFLERQVLGPSDEDLRRKKAHLEWKRDLYTRELAEVTRELAQLPEAKNAIPQQCKVLQ